MREYLAECPGEQKPQATGAASVGKEEVMEIIKLDALLVAGIALARQGQEKSEECAALETILVDVREGVLKLHETRKVA